MALTAQEIIELYGQNTDKGGLSLRDRLREAREANAKIARVPRVSSSVPGVSTRVPIRITSPKPITPQEQWQQHIETCTEEILKVLEKGDDILDQLRKISDKLNELEPGVHQIPIDQYQKEFTQKDSKIQEILRLNSKVSADLKTADEEIRKSALTVAETVDKIERELRTYKECLATVQSKNFYDTNHLFVWHPRTGDNTVTKEAEEEVSEATMKLRATERLGQCQF